MTDQLVEILYILSGSLLAPTLVLLVVFLGGTLMTIGGLLREALDRSLGLKVWRRFLSQLRAREVAPETFYNLSLTGYPARYQQSTRLLEGPLQHLLVTKCLEDIELDIARRLSRLGFNTRLGPMLGLIGTLIPLGPALTGLASGDIHALSGNLVIAFTTTVFGILVGGFAYAASVIRRAWYEQDLSDLEFVVAVMDVESRHGARTLSQQDHPHAP